MPIGKLRTNLAWSLSAFASKLCALLFYGSLWSLPGWQIYTRVISPPNISASILVFLKCQKDRNACTTLSCTKQSVDCLDDSHLFLDAAFSAFSVRSSINGKIP